ncbi:MAG: rod-binding protein [Pseudomonadales bacterium]
MNAAAVYTDLQGLARLKGEITADGGGSQVREVAGQFAAVFTHMMLKSMRDASLGEGIFDSDQSLFYRDLFDQQLALSLANADGGGVGIADLVARELEGGLTGRAEADRALAAYESVRGLAPAAAASTQDPERTADTGSSRNTNWSGQTPREG